jgi:hypothetical protein
VTEVMIAVDGGEVWTVVPGMDHLPPLREPGLVLRTITNTLARAGW